MTLLSFTELVQMYYRLQDVVREWKLLSTKGIDEFETKREWWVRTSYF